MELARRFEALIQRIRSMGSRSTVEMPTRVLEGSAPKISDGLSYDLPLVLPEPLRAALAQQGKLHEWMLENSRDTYRFQFDTPGRSAADMLVMPTIEDPLCEWNHATRVRVASTCHSVFQRNPVAKRAVHYVSAFVVGDGFNLTCKNKDVEALLQAFIDNPDNCLREYERQAVIDLLVDGELFLRFYEAGGDVVAVPLRPWEVEYIHTEPGFFRRPLKYHMQPYTSYNTDDPDQPYGFEAYDVLADEVLHVAINRHSYELRGRSELYSALPWLRAHKEWLENRARQNHWRGALLWWVKIASGLPNVIAAKLAQYQRPPTPGSTVVTSDKEEWSALSNPVGAGDAGEDGRQLKIMALNGIAGIPEYMTGDGENANLATSKSQQLPVMKTFGEFQTIMIEQVWYPIFKRVLTAAIDAGLIGEEVEEQDADGDPVYEEPQDDAQPQSMPAMPGQPMPGAAPAQPAAKPPVKKISTLDAFDVQYEPVGDNEPFTLAQALDIASNNNWVSGQTATTEMGYDYAIEQKRISRERRKTSEAIMRGEIPPPPEMVPQGFGSDGTGDGGGA